MPNEPSQHQLVSHAAVGLYYETHELRFGYDDDTENLDRRSINRTLLDGINRIFQLQSQYMKAYSSQQVVTVQQYRDLLVSLALGKCVRCAQTRDTSYTQLTNHSEQLWNEKKITDFWPELGSSSDEPLPSGFYGPLGSLAFHLYKNNKTGEGLLPLDLLDEMLKTFWLDLEVDPSLFANQRHIEILTKLGVQTAAFNQWTVMLSRLHQIPVSHQPIGARFHHKKLRQLLLNDTDWAFLKQRFILSETIPGIADLIDGVLNWAAGDTQVALFYQLTDFGLASDIQNNIKEIAQPSGMPLIYLAFAIEGYVKAARALTNEAFLLEDLETFLKSENFLDVKLEVARYLALSHDAWAALGRFQTFNEAAGFSYRDYCASLMFVLASKENFLISSGQTRLIDFEL